MPNEARAIKAGPANHILRLVLVGQHDRGGRGRCLCVARNGKREQTDEREESFRSIQTVPCLVSFGCPLVRGIGAK